MFLLLGLMGFEPMFPTCLVGVLPLDESALFAVSLPLCSAY